MSSPVTAFLDGTCIARGDREAVARLLGGRDASGQSAILVFDDASGRVVDLDYRLQGDAAPPRTVGRPRLGVQAREVTLLPRHWEWLAGQPGGASGALRRLVEEARLKGRSDRERKDAAYHFMQALCGDMAGYEEALRALYRSDDAAFEAAIGAWPADVRDYIRALLGEVPAPEAGAASGSSALRLDQ